MLQCTLGIDSLLRIVYKDFAQEVEKLFVECRSWSDDVLPSDVSIGEQKRSDIERRNRRTSSFFIPLTKRFEAFAVSLLG